MAARICVAQIGAAHGVRGEVRLWSFTADPMAVARLRRARERGRHAAFRDRGAAAGQGFPGRAARRRRRSHAAERLRNTDLYVARERLPAAGSGRVLSRRPDRACGRRPRNGATLGTVSAVHNFGAGDLLEMRAGAGRHDRDAAVHRSGRAGGRHRRRPDRGRSAAGAFADPRPTRIESTMWRASVLTIFPGDVSRAAGHEPRRQGARRGPVVARRDRHPRPRAPTSTAPSTTRRPAAAPAW